VCALLIIFINLQPHFLEHHEEEIGTGFLWHPLCVHAAELLNMGDIWLTSGGISTIGSHHQCCWRHP
jgi:hypothetical protein